MIVFDIDGTLADPTHRLKYLQPPKDWDAFFTTCDLDAPIHEGIGTANTFMLVGHTIEFWTGRPERIRTKTRDWLAHHVGSWTLKCPIRMRKDGDRRPDTKVKIEYLNNSVIPTIIFEDRASVVKGFRDLGLTVYQVAEGNF